MEKSAKVRLVENCLAEAHIKVESTARLHMGFFDLNGRARLSVRRARDGGRSRAIDVCRYFRVDSRIVGKTRGKYLERFCVGIR